MISQEDWAATQPPAGSVNIIVASARNGVIGRDGRLPWSIPSDWQYFLDRTRGGVVVLGRVCYEEMVEAGQAGPERTFVVVSRTTQTGGGHVDTESSFDGALMRASEIARALSAPIWIAGGQRIYEASLPVADRLYITRVDAEVDGDTRFPDWTAHFTHRLWAVEESEGAYAFSIELWARTKNT